METQAIYMEDEELCTIEIDEVDCSVNCNLVEVSKKACDDKDQEIKELLQINFEREKVLKRALNTYGEVKQIHKTFEEMAELQKELCKHLEENEPIEQIIRIAEEIADLEVMLEQMKLLFNLHKAVESHKEYKVFRLKQRLDMGVF